MNPQPRAFAETLRRLRTERHLTQEDLADRSMVRPSYICQVELGDSSLTLKNLFRIAEGLGMKASEIVQQIELHQDAADDRHSVP